ncbi:MAG: thiolase family protein [Betaproteobacteria bacterium]|nr:thiolase family protein [Betaproteobacteria bacterium]
MHLRNAVIVDAARSAFGRGAKGQLVSTRLDEVAATVVKALLERNPGIDPAEIEDLILGNVNGSGELSGFPSNIISRVAGLPVEVSSTTVNRQCGSSMQALHMAANSIMTGAGEVALAVGVQRMGTSIVRQTGADTPLTRLHERVNALTEAQKRPAPNHAELFSVDFPRYISDSPAYLPMPQTAQNVAEVWNLTRAEMDRYALESHHRADAAYKAGHYRSQIIPMQIRLPVFDAQGNPDFAQLGPEMQFERDECIRVSTLEKLGSLPLLKGVVSYGGREVVISAGNSCPTNDGASAALVVSDDRAQALGTKPLARIVSMAVSGVTPQLMGIGTIPASAKALKRAGLAASDIGLAEINEAFASQSIVTVRELGLDPQVVNVNGGALAIGHPLGASGVRLLVSLCHEMRRRGNVRYGLATMCIGVGMGIATVVEAIN